MMTFAFTSTASEQEICGTVIGVDAGGDQAAMDFLFTGADEPRPV